MTKQAAGALVVLLVLASIGAAAQEQSQLTVQGRIVDGHTEKPIAGSVTVFMILGGHLETKTTTAAENGRFKLIVPTRPYSALIWADRYAPQEIEEPALELASIRLDLFKDLSGTLQDAQGFAVEGALVRASYVDDERYVPEWMAESLAQQQPVTDADGLFLLHDVVPGRRLWIQAEHSDGEGITRTTPRVSEIEIIEIERGLPAEERARPVALVLKP